MPFALLKSLSVLKGTMTDAFSQGKNDHHD